MTDEEKTIRLTKFPVLLLLGNAITFFVVAMWALLTPAHAVCECWESFSLVGKVRRENARTRRRKQRVFGCAIIVGRYLHVPGTLRTIDLDRAREYGGRPP